MASAPLGSFVRHTTKTVAKKKKTLCVQEGHLDRSERKSCGVASSVVWAIRWRFGETETTIDNFSGWTFDSVSVHGDAWSEAPKMESRSPKEFTDVRDVNASEKMVVCPAA